MGLCLGYQALPEDSALYRRLLDDRRVGELFARLFLYGGGPFAPRNLTFDDLSDLLDDLARHSEVFESRRQAEETARQLFDLVNRAIVRYPGLENRRAYLDKAHTWIKERLLGEIKARGHRDRAGEPLVERLIHGCEGFPRPNPAPLLPIFGDEAPPDLGPLLPLSVVPPPVVREGAEFLREFAPDDLFEDPDHFLREDYGPWRKLYLEAAERGELILIGY
jgi:hypothetical protein